MAELDVDRRRRYTTTAATAAVLWACTGSVGWAVSLTGLSAAASFAGRRLWSAVLDADSDPAGQPAEAGNG